MAMPLQDLRTTRKDEKRSAHSLEHWLAGRNWQDLLFWGASLALLLLALLSRLYHLDAPFDIDSYDEGVYWQSLRAMVAGQSLYHSIFYSQPPAFLLSIFPGFVLFGTSLWAARFGIVLISLVGFIGAALLGKALAGRPGVLVGLFLLLINTRYMSQSQILQADSPSVSFTLLAIGCALCWWQAPGGWRSLVWAGLTGAAVSVSILCKLLCISTLVPIVLLLGARGWQIWHRQGSWQPRDWWSIVAGCATGLLVALLILLPFVGNWSDLWVGMVTFHEAAARAVTQSPDNNFLLIKGELVSFLGLAALYGTIISLWKRNWLMLPLLAWLLVTTFLLFRQNPLFPHHMIALVPPLLALSLLGIAPPIFSSVLPDYRGASIQRIYLIGISCLFLSAVIISSVLADVQYYHSFNARRVSPQTRQDLQVASDLHQAISADQWVITDGQFVAALAARDTPPELVDTSIVRITTGYVTLTELEQSALAPQVHAILFYTHRLDSLPRLQGFYAWVEQHYHLLHRYGPGQELWVR